MISLRRIAAATLIGLAIQGCDGGPTGPKTGSLTVNIADLPPDISAAVIVQGAVGTPPITVAATRTIADLEPGTYTVTAAKAVGSKATYLPSLTSQIVEVTAGSTPITASIAYVLATGIVNVTVSGIPTGSNAAVTLFNSSGFFVNLTASGEVGNLEPGEYTLQADPISADEVYVGAPSPRIFQVTASPTPVQAQVNYAASTGTIQFSPSGLPAGATPVWDVSGPNSFSAVIRGTGPQSISKLVPGQYTVSARNFDFGADTYGAASPSISVTVTAGAKVPASFTYVTRPPTLNLSVEGAYITQSTQRFNGSVPLIEGRAAFLRIFLKANELNSATPNVRFRLYRNGAIVSTTSLTAPAQAVATVLNEGAETWGLLIPATLVTSGLSYLVDADPDNTVREVNETDNMYPVSGTPVALNVRSVPTAELRFVPIETAVNGLIGNVSEGRVAELLSLTLRMFPLSTYSADVRVPFTTSAPVLERDNANRAWERVINELEAVRIAEGTQRNYIGILKTPYSSGVVGLGFFPGKTSLSWDVAGGSAASTIAHELGHNWGRAHAPCGGPDGVDQNYPYPNARIGVYGFDLTARAVLDVNTRDVMSYCSPEWVSDYTYEGIMNFRATTAANISASGSVESALIVWGRMDAANIVLEPAFMSETRPALPVRGGRYRVEAFDASGANVFSLSFEPDKVGDADLSVRQFAFAVPITTANAARIVSLRLAGEGREVRLSIAAPGALNIAATAVSAESVRLNWNAAVAPMLVVRDAETKEILTFARDGVASIRTKRKTLEIAASNGVGSTRIIIQARD